MVRYDNHDISPSKEARLTISLSRTTPAGWEVVHPGRAISPKKWRVPCLWIAEEKLTLVQRIVGRQEPPAAAGHFKRRRVAPATALPTPAARQKEARQPHMPHPPQAAREPEAPPTPQVPPTPAAGRTAVRQPEPTDPPHKPRSPQAARQPEATHPPQVARQSADRTAALQPEATPSPEGPPPIGLRSSTRHGPRSTSAPDGFTAGAHVSFDRPRNASNIDKGVVGLLTGNTETFAGRIRELFYYALLGCPGGEGRGASGFEVGKVCLVQ